MSLSLPTHSCSLLLHVPLLSLPLLVSVHLKLSLMKNQIFKNCVSVIYIVLLYACYAPSPCAAPQANSAAPEQTHAMSRRQDPRFVFGHHQCQVTVKKCEWLLDVPGHRPETAVAGPVKQHSCRVQCRHGLFSLGSTRERGKQLFCATVVVGERFHMYLPPAGPPSPQGKGLGPLGKPLLSKWMSEPSHLWWVAVKLTHDSMDNHSVTVNIQWIGVNTCVLGSALSTLPDCLYYSPSWTFLVNKGKVLLPKPEK